MVQQELKVIVFTGKATEKPKINPVDEAAVSEITQPPITADLFELDRAKIRAEQTQRLVDAISNIRLPDLTAQRR